MNTKARGAAAAIATVLITGGAAAQPGGWRVSTDTSALTDLQLVSAGMRLQTSLGSMIEGRKRRG